MGQVLKPAERRILKALATAALPEGRRLPGASDATLDRAESSLASLPSGVPHAVNAMLWALELGTRPPPRPPARHDEEDVPQGRPHRRDGQLADSDSDREGGGRHDADQLGHVLSYAQGGARRMGPRARRHRSLGR